jgi:hypothetical protein
MTLAIEPMINIGTSDVRLLDDGWTVRTAAACLGALRTHRFDHKRRARNLTWRAKTQLK